MTIQEELAKLYKENQELKKALEVYADPDHWGFYDGWLWNGPVPNEVGSLYRDPGEPARVALGYEEKNKEWIEALKKSREYYSVLNKYFSFTNVDAALDFIYAHLDKLLSAGNYYEVNEMLKCVMCVENFWNKGINDPTLSLSFAIWTKHEPEKFPWRKDFINKLFADYVVRHGEKRAIRLLQGLL